MGSTREVWLILDRMQYEGGSDTDKVDSENLQRRGCQGSDSQNYLDRPRQAFITDRHLDTASDRHLPTQEEYARRVEANFENLLSDACQEIEDCHELITELNDECSELYRVKNRLITRLMKLLILQITTFLILLVCIGWLVWLYV